MYAAECILYLHLVTREHVESELQDASTPAAERQRMLDILQRVQQQDAQNDSSDVEADEGVEDEPCELSEQTLAKLLLRVRPATHKRTGKTGMCLDMESTAAGHLSHIFIERVRAPPAV